MGRSPRYKTMSLDDIKAMPVGSLAADHCALFLWVTDPFLPHGFEVMRSWGFEYKTVAFHWAKTNQDGSYFAGCGYWTRANPEVCLLGTKGSPSRDSKSVRRLVVTQRLAHSQKPAEVYEAIARLCPGPYLDLFAREERPNWTSWGDEVGTLGRSPVVIDGMTQIDIEDFLLKTNGEEKCHQQRL